jgi:hypothetical protein
VGSPRRADHTAPLRTRALLRAGEGLPAPVLMAMQPPPARAPPGRFQTFGRTTRRGECPTILLWAGVLRGSGLYTVLGRALWTPPWCGFRSAASRCSKPSPGLVRRRGAQYPTLRASPLRRPWPIGTGLRRLSRRREFRLYAVLRSSPYSTHRPRASGPPVHTSDHYSPGSLVSVDKAGTLAT